MLKKDEFLALIVLFHLPSLLLAQDLINSDSLRILHLRAAREIMVYSPTCALVTQDESGTARVRTMDPFQPDEDFTIWLATNPRSRKVNEIKKNERVSLYYTGADNTGYVTVYGIAYIVNDQTEKDKRWKNEWSAFYSNRSDEYVLIKVIPVKLEVINYRHGINGDAVTWQPATVLFNHP